MACRPSLVPLASRQCASPARAKSETAVRRCLAACPACARLLRHAGPGRETPKGMARSGPRNPPPQPPQPSPATGDAERCGALVRWRNDCRLEMPKPTLASRARRPPPQPRMPSALASLPSLATGHEPLPTPHSAFALHSAVPIPHSELPTVSRLLSSCAHWPHQPPAAPSQSKIKNQNEKPHSLPPRHPSKCIKRPRCAVPFPGTADPSTARRPQENATGPVTSRLRREYRQQPAPIRPPRRQTPSRPKKSCTVYFRVSNLQAL
jgi:hypothetical protein